MTLSVSLKHQFAGFALDAQFDAPVGVTALFGRSGSGKTTVADGVAGLMRPDHGRIQLDGQVLFDKTGGINVPTRDRRIGYVFQDGRLFPHMSVEKNLAYGGDHDAHRIIAMLGLENLLDRRPTTLSGGERQRVALGRALMSDPHLLLMDEPLSALDGPRKEDILPYLERLRDELHLPILYVSHDMSEVARLATTLVILEQGRVVKAGPLSDVLSDPANTPLLGVREAGAVVTGAVVGYDAKDGLSLVDIGGGQLTLPGRMGQTGDAARVRIAASDVILATERPQGLSALNVLPVTVTGVHAGSGPGVAVGLAIGNARFVARVTRRSAQAMKLREGQALYAILKATAIARQDIGNG